MKIEITEYGTGNCKYRADRPNLCGSPTVGYGKTTKEALGDLIYNDSKSFNIQLELPPEEYNKIHREFLKSR